METVDGVKVYARRGQAGQTWGCSDKAWGTLTDHVARFDHSVASRREVDTISVRGARERRKGRVEGGMRVQVRSGTIGGTLSILGPGRPRYGQ